MSDDTNIDWDGDYSIAKLLGDPLVENYNQHVLMGIIGKTGTGKSNGGLRIAYDTSRYLAFKKGGVPEDYFTLDNVAIITPDEIIRVMKHVKKFQIYVFDDIDVGWNSRDWNSKVNKIMNNIAMTFRTKRNVLILTVPDDEMIDKVPRHLMHYRVDMEQANFSQGYTVGKFQKMVRSYKFKKNMFPYVKNDGKKYIRCIFTRAPPHISEEYEIRREYIQAQMETDNLKELEEMFSKSDDITEPKEPLYKQLGHEIFERIDSGSCTKAKIAEEFGMSLPTVLKAFKYGKKNYKASQICV